ncbi:MAG: YegS/Rv2252/BmrU family lipid kinase [Clostridia bacterium]|nr:YegS/Rv2252/BmrU family lipid kinase [Clostridia bacterium]MDD4375505.1 YegS/Rv2252/BmrU family lipid kinase [Clostridia bacterium]
MIRLVIINPFAGNSRGFKHKKTVEKVWNNIKKEGLVDEDEIIIEVTKHQGHATQIAKRYINKYKNDKIVIYIISGDGTISEVAEATINNDNVSIVIIPKGTGNDFAKAVTSSKSIRKIIRESIKNNPIKVDSIKVNEKVAVNVVNAGLDAAIAENIKYFRKIPFLTGKMKFNLSILITIFSPRKYKFKIRVDNKAYKGKYTLIAIGNNKYYGGGIMVLPNADIKSGFLDVCIVKNTTIFHKIYFLPKFNAGKHENIKLVNMTKAKSVTVVSNKKFPISIDGEIYNVKGFKVKIAENSLNVIKTLDKK